jgi:hemerythrin
VRYNMRRMRRPLARLGTDDKAHMDGNHDMRGWTDEFSVNVKLLDGQHRRLLGTISRLEAAMGQGRAREELAEILVELVSYTGEHFATEEAVLVEYEFPWRDMHALEHRQFAAEMGKLQTQIQHGELIMSIPVLEHLRGWWSRHVLGSDKKYTEHLNARGMF